MILLDVNMPDIDGLETASLIRQYKTPAHTPIIFITAYVDEVQAARGYALGAVDYISSPVVPGVLRSKVKVFVDLHRMHRQAAAAGRRARGAGAGRGGAGRGEEATQRAGFLSHASSVLGGSLDLEVGARRLIELVVPGLADRATVVLPGETSHTQVFRSAGSPAEVSVRVR